MTPCVTTRDQLPVMLMVLIGQPPSGHRLASKAAAIGGLTCDGAGRVALVWHGAAA